MKRLLNYMETHMDNYKIKKKFYIFYISCVLLPLIVTDSVIAYIAIKGEQESRQHDMENIANAVQYSVSSSIESAAELAKTIYMRKHIDDFLSTAYADSLEYVSSYQEFKRNTTIMSRSDMQITFYADNPTIVNGGGFEQLLAERDSEWYKYLQLSGLDKVVYFSYEGGRAAGTEVKRKIMFLQKLNYFDSGDCEKILKIEIDYSNMIRNLTKMNYDTPVYICEGERVILSNKYTSVAKEFESFTNKEAAGFSQKMSLYGTDLTIYVQKTEKRFYTGILNNLPLLLLLLIVNIVLPVLLVSMFNRSFTGRLQKLSEIFNKVEEEHLVEIEDIRGKDEIGSLMRNYNKMAVRINSLIQIVYKNRIIEQEMMVARQNAELLALHSQINPHFLFNALESIRMHSLLKKEYETADMVEKLAIMQRQYVEWKDDLVTVAKEMEFVSAYLALQKYRFGDRLSFRLELAEDCRELKIPKLTVVTFVENACVHGIESKTSTSWIFVRIYKEEERLCMEVEDTGSGIARREAEELLEKMRSANIEMLKGKGRVGIVNACLRLKMISDNKTDFDLESEEGMGTMVQIRIPLTYVNREREEA